jgi:tripeptide aminopeptidase
MVHTTDAETLRDQTELVRIPAPPLQEAARGRRLRERFEALGLEGVRTDRVGNVLGRWPGRDPALTPVVVAAHLDTVFAADADLTPRTRGERIYAPGITDNTRGLAGMLALARVLAGTGARAPRPIVFAGTVGEEGIGDLRGVKHLFRDGSPLRDAAAFVALDGSGMRRIVHRGIGSRRLRAELRGPGGHSWSERGAPNPLAALAACAAELSAAPLPEPRATSLTVARMGGGTAINAIPDGAWMEVDMRSEVDGVLPRLETMLRRGLDAAVQAANGSRRKGSSPLAAEVRVIGDRPAGRTPPDVPLVRAAARVTRALGGEPELVACSSDSNVPMAAGIPSITIGAGGDSGGIHTLDEWYSNEHGPLGIERALLVLLAVAGWEDEALAGG